MTKLISGLSYNNADLPAGLLSIPDSNNMCPSVFSSPTRPPRNAVGLSSGVANTVLFAPI